MTDQEDIIYRVNRLDEIVFVNEAWDQFSLANGGESTVSARVVGHSLWDFIMDSTTRELYRRALERIRTGASLQFLFRCDSPTCRRRLEMGIYPVPDGAIEFRTRALSEERREPPILFGPPSGRSHELLRVCGWCKRVFVKDAWVEVEEAAARLQLFERSDLPTMTHGICDECHQSLLESIAVP